MRDHVGPAAFFRAGGARVSSAPPRNFSNDSHSEVAAALYTFTTISVTRVPFLTTKVIHCYFPLACTMLSALEMISLPLAFQYARHLPFVADASLEYTTTFCSFSHAHTHSSRFTCSGSIPTPSALSGAFGVMELGWQAQAQSLSQSHLWVVR